MAEPAPNIPQPHRSRPSPLQWGLSIIAALNCLVVVTVFALNNTPNFPQDLLSLWPFPLIYFLEITSIGFIGLIATVKALREDNSNWSAALWVSSGILLTFVILGSWTIGFFLIPAMLCYLILGINIDRNIGGDIPRQLVIFVIAGISQAVLVLITFFG